MTHELLLAGLVRDWASGAVPGEPAAADAAVVVALRCHAGGASVREACREARRFVECWTRHPSHPPVDREQQRPIAS